MIFKSYTSEEKKKLSRWIVGLGFIALIVGVIPGLLSLQWGIVLFIFSFVISGIIKIIVPEPDPADSSVVVPSRVEEVLKSGEEKIVEADSSSEENQL